VRGLQLGTVTLLLACSSAEQNSTSNMTNTSGGSSTGTGGTAGASAGGSMSSGSTSVSNGGDTSSAAGTISAGGAEGGETGIGGDAGAGGEPSFGGAPDLNPGNPCAQNQLEFTPVKPIVELLVSRANRMSAEFGNSTLWEMVKGVLVDTVSAWQADVRFGLSLYSNPDPLSCPNLISTPFDFNNYPAIYDAFAATEPMGESPLGDSIVAATARLEAFQGAGLKVIIILADDNPDSCADPESDGTEDAQDLAVEAVRAARDKGIVTRVVMLDAFSSLDFVQALTNAGAETLPATYHNVYTPAELTTAYQEILTDITTCEFQLNGTVLPDQAHTGLVTIGEQQVPYALNTWQLVNGNIVRLMGPTCEMLKSSIGPFNIAFPCGAVTFQ